MIGFRYSAANSDGGAFDWVSTVQISFAIVLHGGGGTWRITTSNTLGLGDSVSTYLLYLYEVQQQAGALHHGPLAPVARGKTRAGSNEEGRGAYIR